MVSKRRRFIIIIISVSCGSLISLWIVKQRLGTLKPSDYFSLATNFFFAAALVVGLSLFLQRMSDKEDEEQKK
jgi:hypothetical protein